MQACQGSPILYSQEIVLLLLEKATTDLKEPLFPKSVIGDVSVDPDFLDVLPTP